MPMIICIIFLVMFLSAAFIIYPILYVVLFIQMLVSICQGNKNGNLFRKVALFAMFNILLLIIGLFAFGIVYSNFYSFGLYSALLSVIMLIVVAIFVEMHDPLSDYGYNEMGKIKAFKNFLEDFSIMDQRDLPEIKLWEKYLAYAVVLGCADKLEKTMKVKYDELGITNEAFDIYVGTFAAKFFSETLNDGGNFTHFITYTQKDNSIVLLLQQRLQLLVILVVLVEVLIVVALVAVEDSLPAAEAAEVEAAEAVSSNAIKTVKKINCFFFFIV